MKNVQNHEFKYKFWVAPFLAIVILMCLALSPFGKTSLEDNVMRARNKAEVLAYQAAQLFRENSRDGGAQSPRTTSSRGPTSINSDVLAEGLMGQDPWGHGFSYKISPDGEHLRVEMRSAGPDGIPDQRPESDDVVLTLSL